MCILGFIALVCIIFAQQYNFMDRFDSYIPRHLLLISLVCSLFVTYPNVVWIPYNLERLETDGETGFWAFFFFRMLYFYGLFYFQLRYNLRQIGNVSFAIRLCYNFIYTFVCCAVFVALSFGLPMLGIQTGYVGNILLFQFFVVCLLCAFIGFISVLHDSRREKEQEIERLKVENLQSRIDALVSQINPHFFFNSLNGISSLIRKGNSDDTLSYVTKLSDIFRYILQSDRKGLVTLGEELEFVNAFRHVMEVRFANKLTFAIDVPSDRHGLMIPVLSLLPLIENVTVHNMIDIGHLMNINIRLAEDNVLEISNPVYPKLTLPDTNGTGLHNLRHRFKLMLHKDIRVEADGEMFIVKLPLTEKII